MIHETIEEIRTTSGLTMAQLAYLFHVSRPTLYKWRDGGSCQMSHREHILEVSVLMQEAKQRLGDALTNWLLTPVSPSGKKPITYLGERHYDIFRGFLLHVPLSEIRYIERSREEQEDTLERLRPRAFYEDDEEPYWAGSTPIPDEVIGGIQNSDARRGEV